MQRRNFIKSMTCIGCVGLAAFSHEIFFNRKTFIDNFIYKSKQDLPTKIRLEACSLCQLNCPECDTRRNEKQAPKNWLGYLKFKDFKNFVDEYNFKEIELANMGEIFLNPELDEIIEYAHLKNIFLTANTGVNLNTVSEKTLENLVRYKFGKLTVSLDGATGETYKIYRRGGDFDVVIDNIKKINYFKEKYNSEFPKLTWQFILFGHNEHEIELAKERARGLNMRMRFKKNSFPWYSPVKNLTLIEKQTGLNMKLEDKIYFACKTMFQNPQINYNGDLLGCCRIYPGNHGANAFKDGLLNALNSQNFIYAKKMLTDLSTTPKNIIPCSNCTDYIQLKTEKQPLDYKAPINI